jgi:CBS domain-containing protein
MSPRAACRLQTLGFTQIYDYAAGKADWLAHGLPTEGTEADVPRATQALRHDVATATLDEPVGPIRQRVAASPYGFALVVAADHTLLGRLRRAALDGDPTARAADVMEAGPSTVRPDRSLTELTARMRARDLRTVLVTDPEGKLLGVIRRDDLEA